MTKTFVIDYLPESAPRYVSDYAIVAIDVIRATTMAVTAVAMGHKCYSVTSVEEAHALASVLENPILAGELRGIMPERFHMNNSPAELVRRGDTERPLILLSSSGTQLLQTASSCPHVYVACLRNCYAVSRYMAERHPRVALIGAGSRGEFREEDQLCCAWMGRYLMEAGYVPEDSRTADIVEQWREEPVAACAIGASGAYLQRSGQLDDLDFVLAHVNDLSTVFMLDGRELVAVRRAVQSLPEKRLATVAY
ncbi:MAG: 2-phosphosulfolactate phosphatase [Acidobacteriota bacterium]|nr:2-phosphosulfolactate phosphatase [Acidobacteriota bacterium]